MLKGFIGLVICGALAFANSAKGSTAQQQDQLAAMNAILLELQTQYGMVDFKEEHFNITLQGLREKYSHLIETAQTLEEAKGFNAPIPRDALSKLEFQQLMIGMIAELRDGHVNVLRQTRNFATLGILSTAIDGHLYVSGFREQFFLKDQFTDRVQVGDEILEIDGLSVQDVARRRLLYTWGGTFQTRWDNALAAVLEVPYAWFLPMPVGRTVELKIQRGSKVFMGRVPWVEGQDYSVMRNAFPKEPKDRSAGFRRDSEVPYGTSGAVRSYFRQGLLNSHLPDGSVIDLGALLNQELAQSADADVDPVTRLMAYMVLYKGRKIGVLRVPSYSPSDSGGILNEINWLKKIMPRLQNSTDMLILDVLSNAGGSVFESNRITSFFAKDGPIPGTSLNIRLSETFLESHRPRLSQNPESGEPTKFAEWFLEQRFYEQLVEKYRHGEKWSGFHPEFPIGSETDMDAPSSLFAPHAVAYKGPILILNDRFSGSGGDFVPAMLQSAQRGYVMGETSMGLGGPVYRSVDSMPGSELSMRCTIGLCLRADGLPIENIGVVPDIPREIEADDLTNGFRRYSFDVLETALMVLDGKPHRELQAAIQSRQNWRKAFTAKPTLQDVQKIANEYHQAFATIQHLTDWAPLLDHYLPAIKEAGSQLQPADWRDVVVPLPTPLVDSDLILSSLWRKEEVINRLQEMRKLPALQSQADVLDLLEKVLQWAEGFDGEVRFANPCDLLLMKKSA